MKVSRYFKLLSTHFKRKNLLMKEDFFEDLSELDDFSTVIKLHYLKEILIPAKWKHKIQPSWLTETTDIEASFHLHRFSTEELSLKIWQKVHRKTPAQASSLQLYLKADYGSGVFLWILSNFWKVSVVKSILSKTSKIFKVKLYIQYID